MASDEAEPSYDQTDDYVAARVQAYANLVATVLDVHDPVLMSECLLMLRATRMSFKTIPQAALSTVSKEASA